MKNRKVTMETAGKTNQGKRKIVSAAQDIVLDGDADNVKATEIKMERKIEPVEEALSTAADVKEPEEEKVEEEVAEDFVNEDLLNNFSGYGTKHLAPPQNVYGEGIKSISIDDEDQDIIIDDEECSDIIDDDEYTKPPEEIEEPEQDEELADIVLGYVGDKDDDDIEIPQTIEDDEIPQAIEDDEIPQAIEGSTPAKDLTPESQLLEDGDLDMGNADFDAIQAALGGYGVNDKNTREQQDSEVSSILQSIDALNDVLGEQQNQASSTSTEESITTVQHIEEDKSNRLSALEEEDRLYQEQMEKLRREHLARVRSFEDENIPTANESISAEDEDIPSEKESQAVEQRSQLQSGQETEEDPITVLEGYNQSVEAILDSPEEQEDVVISEKTSKINYKEIVDNLLKAQSLQDEANLKKDVLADKVKSESLFGEESGEQLEGINQLILSSEDEEGVLAKIESRPTETECYLKSQLGDVELKSYEAEIKMEDVGEKLTNLADDLKYALNVVNIKKELSSSLFKNLVEQGLYYVEVEDKEYPACAIPDGLRLVRKEDHLYCMYDVVPNTYTGYRTPAKNFMNQFIDSIKSLVTTREVELSLVDDNHMNILTVGEYKVVEDFLTQHDIVHKIKGDKLLISAY